MARKPSLSGPETPNDFPQVQPTDPVEMFPTNNIRHVITETAKLMERVDHLRSSIDKLATTVEKGFERSAADFKERLELSMKPVDDLRTDMKDVKTGLHDIEKKVSFVRGALWVLGGLFAIAVVLLGAVAKGWFH